MEKSYLEILKQVKLFDSITEQELGPMLDCLGSKIKIFQKGDYILSAGDEVNSIGIVISGQVEIVKEDIMGRRTLISSLGQTDIFGEAMACAGIKKSPTSVLAGSRTAICFTDYSRVVTSCTSSCGFHSLLIQNMLKLMAHKNLFLNKKLDYLSLKSMREKLSSYLLDQYSLQRNTSFSIPLNREGLADYLAVDRSAMSRELGRMRDEGLISFERNHFQLLYPEGLI